MTTIPDLKVELKRTTCSDSKAIALDQIASALYSMRRTTEAQETS